MNRKLLVWIGILIMSWLPVTLLVGQSTAMHWNELLLQAIREDLARPTVHARNLWHTSAAMYDVWALFDDEAQPYLIGNTVHDFESTFEGFQYDELDRIAYCEIAIDYAAYLIIKERFKYSLNSPSNKDRINAYMAERGYDMGLYDQDNVDYTSGDPTALGTYIAQQYLTFGLQDGSNELSFYRNQYYSPVNKPIDPSLYGNKSITDPNRWQTVDLPITIDQSGNKIESAPPFLGAEWGNVLPFSLDDPKIYTRDSQEYKVFYDPGPPPLLDTIEQTAESEMYKWGFSLVPIWSSHCDPTDSVIWDISPASQGNLNAFPETLEGYKTFYNLYDGGDPGKGHTLNPATGKPYEPNRVYRGDYVRALAEFWADGPDSETPPGHWFTIINTVNQHPELKKQFAGKGDVLDSLEWDIKTYFLLGANMHDAAINTWALKGYYDYVRPVSAVRYMADRGQSSDPKLPNYHVAGLPLVKGYIELISEGDTLAGEKNEYLNHIKLYTWKGPNYIKDPEIDAAGVGWVRAGEWWPYQRPTFVTPNFSGYLSGHSTYSRSAAEILTAVTGDEFFPGGMGTFEIEKNEFLVFEEGPSESFELQWATYRDASDQTSLSRIWGGIHPPLDDIPGRKIGIMIADQVFKKARDYFYNDVDGDGLYSYEDCDDNDPKRPLKKKCRKQKKVK